MKIIDEWARTLFREWQIRGIKAEIRRKYAERIRGAKTRAEKKALKAQRRAEIVDKKYK